MGWFIDRAIAKWEEESGKSIERMTQEMINKRNIASALESGTITFEEYLNLLKAENMKHYKQKFAPEVKFETGSVEGEEVRKAMEVLSKAVSNLFKGKVDKRIKRKKAA